MNRPYDVFYATENRYIVLQGESVKGWRSALCYRNSFAAIREKAELKPR